MLASGDVALRIPEHLVITLARVFGDEVSIFSGNTSQLLQSSYSCPRMLRLHTGQESNSPTSMAA